MPTYDYKCNACGHAFEEFQSMSAPHLKKCPKCGKNKLERLIGTGAALMFKGSGFYITDYRSDSYKKAAEAEKGGGGAGGAGSDSKKSEPAAAGAATAEAKTAEKSDAKSDGKAKSDKQSASESKPKGKKTSKSDK